MPALEPLLATPPQDAYVVVTAGELRKTAPLRKLFDAGEERRRDRLLCRRRAGPRPDHRPGGEAAGLAIADDARAALKELIGGDRMASRSEIAKLCLYAAGTGEITVDDVRAVVGDASAFAVDEAVDAAALGDAAVSRGSSAG